MPFQYKKVLVVGATSGIGQALAAKFIEQGSKVVVVGRRQEKLDEFIKAHGEDKASAIQCDVSNLSGIPKFAESVTKAHPDLDCIFLNSGIQRAFDFSKPETVDLSILDSEVTTNYNSFLHMTVAFTPFLQKKDNQTAFLYTTSGLGLVPMMRAPNYCATKAALHHWILVLREQLKKGPGNIKVVEIYPPAVQTELHDTKHQPDLVNGHQIGIPLDKFVQEAYAGLEAGQDEVVVDMVKHWHGSFEPKRQELFHEAIERMGKMLSQHKKK